MQSSAYNNPLFANGLARLVQSFIGNPAQQGQAELSASQALLNNQTAQYREAIGDTGLSGDLASMMIRALQAGPDYSRYAPTLGREALSMGAMGFGPPQLTPSGGLAGAFMGGGRRRGGGGSASPEPAAAQVRPLTQSELGRADRMVRNAGYQGTDGAIVMDAIAKAYAEGGYSTLDEAAAAVLPRVSMQDVPTGEIDQNDSWYNPFDWFTGPEPITAPRAVVAPIEVPIPTPEVGAAAADGLARPKSKSEYDALPRGTRYVTPDGQVLVKK